MKTKGHCFLALALFGLAIFLPISTVFSAPGDLYVATGIRVGGDVNRILKFTPAAVRSDFATGLNPFQIAFDRSGNLFATNSSSHSIVKITPDGTKTTFTSNLTQPLSLAFDSQGNLFVGDFADNAIYKFTPGGTRTTFVSSLNQPSALAFDHEGNLFESDFGSGQIFKFTPEGTKIPFASGLDMPEGLAFDAAGNLFAAEFGAHVYKFTSEGARTTFASDLTRAYGVAFDSAGNLYVCDNEAGVIARYTPNGMRSNFTFDTQSPRHMAFEPASGKPRNLSTRARVQAGDNLLIGGFIATGSVPKQLIVRAIGPSLAARHITGFLPDPTLELRDRDGFLVASNDNWKLNDQTQQSQEAAIVATTVPPPNNLESAVLVTLTPRQAYTAIVRGAGGGTGVALVEAYDLNPQADSKLANISTRGLVETGENVMIGGFILGGNGARLIVRAKGPSLLPNVQNALADPTLEVRDRDGLLLASNDNWKINDATQQSQEAEIVATTLQPTNDFESALIASLPAGAYTAIVRGKGNTIGVGLVEVFTLQ